MSWNQVGCHWVVLGCPFRVFTFCNGTYHLMIDEFQYNIVGKVEQCNPQKHRRVEAVPTTQGEQFLDNLLAKEKG